MKRKLYLDDLRNPPDSTWCVVRNYEEFYKWIEINVLPGTISFDHDLGEGPTGYDAIKWLCNWILDRPEINKEDLPEIRIHSANPVGRENIEMYWKNFVNHFG